MLASQDEAIYFFVAKATGNIKGYEFAKRMNRMRMGSLIFNDLQADHQNNFKQLQYYKKISMSKITLDSVKPRLSFWQIWNMNFGFFGPKMAVS